MPAMPRIAGSSRCHRLRAGASSRRPPRWPACDGAGVGHCPTRHGKRGALRPADALGQHHGDDHDGQDAGEHLVEREQVAEAGDGVADALRRREELADQDADQAAADRDAGAGDDVGQHARDRAP